MDNYSHRELSETVYKWLRQTNNKINFKYCKEEITTHVDYPAVTSIVDFLDGGGMKYEAVLADDTYLDDFNYPLLAHIKEPGNEFFVIVNSIEEWNAPKNTIQNWSGIVIYPHKGSKWWNEDNNEANKKDKKQKMNFAILIVIAIFLWGISVFMYRNFLINLFGLISVIGIFISLAAASTELGIQNKLIKQVCGAVNKGGCESVLDSKYAKGFLGITPSDVGVIYFMTQFIVYSISIFYPVFSVLKYLSIAGLIVAGLSFYFQGVRLKIWCALCIGMASGLIFQGLISFFLPYELDLIGIVTFASICLVISPIFFFVKSLLKKITQLNPKLAQLNKWQADKELFLMLSEKENAIDTTIWENDLILGNVNAPLTVTVACNPYCGPCERAHIKLDKILNKFPGKVKVQIRLLCDPVNSESERTIAVKAILQEAAVAKSNSDLQMMLNDWFESMDLTVWRKKWNSGLNANIDDSLNMHSDWIQQSFIRYTPTLFVNGKGLPGRYDLTEFEKLVPQLVN